MKLARSAASIVCEVAADIAVAAGMLLIAASIGGAVALIVVNMGPPT